MKYKNNPFNIRYSEKNNWLGLSGSKNGFCEFEDISYAVRAVLCILRSYNKRGIETIKDIISTFAPPTENNTSGYISFVCRCMNCSQNWPVDVALPVATYRFVSALSKFESGHDLLEIEFDSGFSLFYRLHYNIFENLNNKNDV